MENEIKAVVMAQKTLHKGMLFGSVSNGGAVVNISHGIAIKFIAEDEKWCTIQIITTGIGAGIKGQRWQKTKTVTVQKTLNKPVNKKTNKLKTFVPDEDIKKKDVV